VEMQRAGRQSILDNFKKYTEAKFGWKYDSELKSSGWFISANYSGNAA
jgi:hypothetical protein